MATITETILRRYGIAGSVVSEEELSGGNVNRTYRVSVRDGAKQIRYLVQKLNPEAVIDPRSMLRNMVVVTDHLHRKRIKTAELYPVARSGERYLELRRSRGTEYWRVEEYLEAVDVSSEDPDVIREMARAFGRFDMALTDLPARRLRGLSNGFHNTFERFRNLWQCAEEDPLGRTAEVRKELAALKDIEAEACEISMRYSAGEYPVRVTHNDTKFNNVLFTKKDAPYGAVVIDFDTVAEGMIAYDFADSVRSVGKIVSGSEEYPQAMTNPKLFLVIAEGYLAETRGVMTEAEVSAMAPCTLAVSAELSARYLADYIVGDRYFKIAEPLQNLKKARLNLSLAQNTRTQMPELRAIIDSIAHGK